MIEDNSIDLIVTSPPYNLDMNYKSCDDNQPYDEYLKFTKNGCEELTNGLSQMKEYV